MHVRIFQYSSVHLRILLPTCWYCNRNFSSSFNFVLSSPLFCCKMNNFCCKSNTTGSVPASSDEAYRGVVKSHMTSTWHDYRRRRQRLLIIFRYRRRLMRYLGRRWTGCGTSLSRATPTSSGWFSELWSFHTRGGPSNGWLGSSNWSLLWWVRRGEYVPKRFYLIGTHH